MLNLIVTGKAINGLPHVRTEYTGGSSGIKQNHRIHDEIIYALSIGLTQEQYWEMTQYEIELIQEAQNRKWEKEKRVEIFTINTIMLS